MKALNTIFTVILSAAIAIGIVSYMNSKHDNAPTQSAAQESAYDRVLRTGTLRCGYADWPPNMFMKDAKTGQITGIMADVTEAMAAKLKIKVEWTEPEGWGSFIESLRAHRIDAFCPGVWYNGERGRYVAFTVPTFYNAVYAYVTPDEHRFDQDFSVVNDPAVRIAVMDGEMTDVIAKEHFPKATAVSVPQLGQITDVLVNVATHKADIVFTEAAFADDYVKTNPGQLRRAQDKPFVFFPAGFAVDIHEIQLREMLSNALVELHNQGVIERILDKYHANPAAFMPISRPYKLEPKAP